MLRFLDNTQTYTPSRTTLHIHTQQNYSERVVSPSQWPLSTQPTQETNIHALIGIRTRDPSYPEAADLRLKTARPPRSATFLYMTQMNCLIRRVKLGDGLIKNPPHAPMRGSGHTHVNMQNKTSCRLYPVVVSASGFNSSDSFLVTRQTSAELSLCFCYVSLKCRK